MFTPQDDLPLPLQKVVTALHVLPPIFNALEDDK